ncbi:hypothetical protein GJAV_G00157660 [Gymnothorax javanicus]|nr:hypothetical protein GJAV_G00157660 [Gymnothorax javanicus]
MYSLEEEPMDTYDNDMHWFYRAECGDWHMFGERENRVIEENYCKSWKTFMEYFIDECKYRLDFSEMKQINLTTKQERPINRTLYYSEGHRKVTAPVPSNWKTDLPFQLISLDSDTQECQEVVDMFAETVTNIPIRSIKRIQNTKLWKSFCRKRDQLTLAKQMPIEERKLFHGTSPKNIRSICSANFDLKFVGTHGSVLGKGIYFARHASLSRAYCSTPGSNNGLSPSLSMILARVLVGEYTHGRSGFFEAPSKDRNGTSFYDSCVDNVLYPNVFVVFDSNQVYPEYLIEF